MDILVNVVNQKLRIATNLKSLVSGTQEFIRFVFNLSNDWDGLTTFVQFVQDGIAYNQYLDDENGAYLPAEIGTGTCTLMLYGSANNTKATTNYLTLTIDENILVSDASSTEISLSLYNQLVNKVNEIKRDIGTQVEEYLRDNPPSGDGSVITGSDGGYYIPSVDSAGNLKWTASKTGMASVLSSNIKGPKGDPGAAGRTPVKGTDYWTASERQAMIDDVLAAIPVGDEVSY